MSDWIHKLVKREGGREGGRGYIVYYSTVTLIKGLVHGLLHCDVSLHSVWYSICQSLLYIIIFHHNDIIQSNDGKLILLIII